MQIDMYKAYRTRDGQRVRILCIDAKGEYCVIGLRRPYPNLPEVEIVTAWLLDGRYNKLPEGDKLDLMEMSVFDELEIDAPVEINHKDLGGWRPRHFAGLSVNGFPTVFPGGLSSWTAKDRSPVEISNLNEIRIVEV